MDRIDLFTSIHKGIRRSLFETARMVAAADFGDPLECERTGAAVARLYGFLDEHAACEDAVVLPEIAALAPELFIDLRAEHARVDGLQREIEGMLARLDGATECERVSLGRRIEDRFGKLVAAHLLHLAREEKDANRVLWAHRDDAQLADLRRRMVARVTPERLAEWYALALPAMNARERRGILLGMRAGMPAELFELVTAGARAELGERSWREALPAGIG